MSSSPVAAELCEHAWGWVSPAGTSESARLCTFCHQPDPKWLNEVHEKGPQNIPAGLYRNKLGTELHVVEVAMEVGHCRTMGGDISIAEARNRGYGSHYWLVTARSLTEAGYEKVSES